MTDGGNLGEWSRAPFPYFGGKSMVAMLIQARTPLKEKSINIEKFYTFRRIVC